MMYNVIGEEKGRKQQCFHLEGIPLHWTETDLQTALIAVGVSEIQMLQILTKKVSTSSGAPRVIANGAALLLFNDSRGREFLDDLLISHCAPTSSDGLQIKVRKLELPEQVRDLQTYILQNLAHEELVSDNIPMALFYEMHKRTLRVREKILKINFHQYALEECNVEGQSTIDLISGISQRPIQLQLMLGNSEDDVKRNVLGSEFVVVGYEGKIPCFKFTEIIATEKSNDTEFASKDAPLSAEEQQVETVTSASSPVYSVKEQYEMVSPEVTGNADEVIWKAGLGYDPRTIGSFGETVQESKFITTSNRVSVLNVEDVPFQMNSVEVKSSLERQLQGVIAFCARFKSRIQVLLEGQRKLIFDVPQRACAVIFRDTTAEKKCLEKMTFSSQYSSNAGSSIPCSLIVTLMSCDSKIADVWRAFNDEVSLRQEVVPSEMLDFEEELKDVIIASEEDIFSQSVRAKFWNERGYEIVVLQKDIINVQNEWIKSWIDSPVRGSLTHSESSASDTDDGSVTPEDVSDMVKVIKASITPVVDIPCSSKQDSPNVMVLAQPGTSSNCHPTSGKTLPLQSTSSSQDSNAGVIHPLYVKGVYYHWNCCDLGNYFESEMNSPVKFSAIYSKVMKGRGNDTSNEELRIPMGHGVILFESAAAEAECLRRARFQPRGLPHHSNGARRFLTVQLLSGFDIIADVRAAANLRQNVLMNLTASEELNLLKMYENEMINRHNVLLDNQWRFNKLMKENHATFKILSANHLELATDWWVTRRDAKM